MKLSPEIVKSEGDDMSWVADALSSLVEKDDLQASQLESLRTAFAKVAEERDAYKRLTLKYLAELGKDGKERDKLAADAQSLQEQLAAVAAERDSLKADLASQTELLESAQVEKDIAEERIRHLQHKLVQTKWSSVGTVRQLENQLREEQSLKLSGMTPAPKLLAQEPHNVGTSANPNAISGRSEAESQAIIDNRSYRKKVAARADRERAVAERSNLLFHYSTGILLNNIRNGNDKVSEHFISFYPTIIYTQADFELDGMKLRLTPLQCALLTGNQSVYDTIETLLTQQDMNDQLMALMEEGLENKDLLKRIISSVQNRCLYEMNRIQPQQHYFTRQNDSIVSRPLLEYVNQLNDHRSLYDMLNSSTLTYYNTKIIAPKKSEISDLCTPFTPETAKLLERAYGLRFTESFGRARATEPTYYEKSSTADDLFGDIDNSVFRK